MRWSDNVFTNEYAFRAILSTDFTHVTIVLTPYWKCAKRRGKRVNDYACDYTKDTVSRQRASHSSGLVTFFARAGCLLRVDALKRGNVTHLFSQFISRCIYRPCAFCFHTSVFTRVFTTTRWDGGEGEATITSDFMTRAITRNARAIGVTSRPSWSMTGRMEGSVARISTTRR